MENSTGDGKVQFCLHVSKTKIAAKCPSNSKILARGALSSSSLFLTLSLHFHYPLFHTQSNANPKAAHITLWFCPSFTK